MATYFVNWTSSNVYGLTLITCDSSLEWKVDGRCAISKSRYRILYQKVNSCYSKIREWNKLFICPVSQTFQDCYIKAKLLTWLVGWCKKQTDNALLQSMKSKVFESEIHKMTYFWTFKALVLDVYTWKWFRNVYEHRKVLICFQLGIDFVYCIF